MVRRSLFQIIKKKIFLFLSLVFITTIGVMFSTGFVSCYLDYKREALAYINDYGLPDIILKTSEFVDSDVSSIKIYGAEVFYRFQGDADITINEKVYKTKLTTFDSNSFSKRYVLSKVNDSLDKININLDFSFAHCNNIQAGSNAILKINSKSENLYINQIVGNPEAIDYYTDSIVPVDRYNYGCSYIDKASLKESSLGIKNNQAIVKITDTSQTKEMIEKNLSDNLSEKGITTYSTIFKEDNSSYKFITSNDRDMKKIAILVPACTIGILLIIIFLFMYQVSKSLTHEFGIMIALGNSIKSITLLLLGFATMVSIVGSALGILCGHFFSTIMYNVFKDSFYVPSGYGGVLFPISLFSFLGTLVITYLAVLSTVLVIRRISPLEAINNSKNEYKPLIKPIDKLVNKTGVSSKIAISSVFKEKVRSFVSIFAIIASFTICFGALNLYQSESGMINQLYDRHNYTAEVYIKDDRKYDDVEKFIIDEKGKGAITEYEKSGVAYLGFNNNNFNLPLYGIYDSNMHNIVDANNQRISIKEGNYIVVDYYYARENGIKKGDVITATAKGITLTVQEICHSCSYHKNYIHYDTLGTLGFSYRTICINSNDLNSFLKDVLNAESEVNSSIDVLNMVTYAQTITSGYQALIMLSEGIVALGVVVGVATLIIMAVVSMNEQKRKFSIMQTLGLKVSEVSKVIFIQNSIFILLGLAIGIPCGKYFAALLVKIATTNYTMPINFNHWWLYLIVAGMMILITGITHLISTIQIKRINLVANTCSRE